MPPWIETLLRSDTAAHTLWLGAGWTMLHFLWVGAALLAAGALVRLLLWRAPARVRYAASLALLAALVAAPIAIAWRTAQGLAPLARAQTNLLSHDTSQSRPLGETSLTPATEPTFQQPARVFQQPSRAEPLHTRSLEESPPAGRPAVVDASPGSKLTQTFSEYPPLSAIAPPRDSGWLVGMQTIGQALLEAVVAWGPWLWLVGSPLTLLLIASGVVGAERLRRSAAPVEQAGALAAFELARRQMRVAQRVALLVSDRVAQPILLGVLRPAILLPVALLAEMSPEELELVLLHELAHVRRHDNLVNLLQRVVEAALFFHPAVWIASRWVRRDREECCDALVVGAAGRHREYAGLLVRIAEKVLAARGGIPAIGAAMAQPPLARRVRRLLKLEGEPMRVSRWMLATVTLATGLTCVWLWGAALAQELQPVRRQPPGRPSVQQFPVQPADPVTQPVPATGFAPDQQSDTYRAPHNAPAPYAEPQWGSWPAAGWSTPGQASQPLPREAGPPPPFGAPTAGLITGYVASTQGFQFPTDQEQAFADMAFRVLSLEVEKPSSPEIALAKSLGFEGGVRIASTQGPDGSTRSPWIRPGDLLVGLHTTPIADLAKLAEFFNRDDLLGLTPLKAYVVRPAPQAVEGFAGGGVAPQWVGVAGPIVSGRISIDIDAWRQIQAEQSPGPPTPDPLRGATLGNAPSKQQPLKPRPASKYEPAPAAQGGVRYQGNTFEQWNSLWRRELSAELRLKAVDALASFARVGYAEQAAEALLDVAGEYNWKGFGEDGFNANSIPSGVVGLQRAIIDGLTDLSQGGPGVPIDVALPAVVQRCSVNPDQYRGLLLRTLQRWPADHPTVKRYLESAMEGEDPELARGAFQRLVTTLEAEAATDLIESWLTAEDPKRVEVALYFNLLDNGNLYTDPRLVESFAPLLWSGDPGIQPLCRRSCDALPHPMGRDLFGRVTKRLTTATELKEQVECCRALVALRNFGSKEGVESARKELVKMLDTKQEAATTPATVALVAITSPAVQLDPNIYIHSESLRKCVQRFQPEGTTFEQGTEQFQQMWDRVAAELHAVMN